VDEASAEEESRYALVAALTDADSDDDMAYEVSAPLPTPSMPALTSEEANATHGSCTRFSGPVAEVKDDDLPLMAPSSLSQSVFKPEKQVCRSCPRADCSEPTLVGVGYGRSCASYLCNQGQYSSRKALLASTAVTGRGMVRSERANAAVDKGVVGTPVAEGVERSSSPKLTESDLSLPLPDALPYPMQISTDSEANGVDGRTRLFQMAISNELALIHEDDSAPSAQLCNQALPSCIFPSSHSECSNSNLRRPVRSSPDSMLQLAAPSKSSPLRTANRLTPKGHAPHPPCGLSARLDTASRQNLFKSGHFQDSGLACPSQPLASGQSRKIAAETQSGALLSMQRTMRHKGDRNGRMRYHAGRPNLEAMFQEVEDEATALGESRVALLVCGNKGVLESCLRIARMRQGRVQFDPHYEAFGF
jgi:hypothetical protein